MSAVFNQTLKVKARHPVISAEEAHAIALQEVEAQYGNVYIEGLALEQQSFSLE